MEDGLLSKNISIGNRKAFNILTERYYKSLCAFAFQIVDDYDTAEDVVQDTLVNIWVKRSRLSEVEEIKSYLYASVRNLAISTLRTNKRNEAIKEKVEIIEEDIYRNYIEQETYRLLMEAINQLPPRTSEVIRASLNGTKQQVISEEMGITIATVKALKADGIKKLRSLLKHLQILLILH